jgi:hypothetical protein
VKPERIHDDLTCTSSDLKRFYSYRTEKGKTGRMLALLGRRGRAAKPQGVSSEAADSDLQ